MGKIYSGQSPILSTVDISTTVVLTSYFFVSGILFTMGQNFTVYLWEVKLTHVI